MTAVSISISGNVVGLACHFVVRVCITIFCSAPAATLRNKEACFLMVEKSGIIWCSIMK